MLNVLFIVAILYVVQALDGASLAIALTALALLFLASRVTVSFSGGRL